MFREFRRAVQLHLQQFVPLLRGLVRNIAGRRSRRRAHAHFVFAPPLAVSLVEPPPAGAVADTFAAAVCAAAFGAPVNPAAAPTPSISSQRGHGFDGAPCNARSITSRAIFSTTISK